MITGAELEALGYTLIVPELFDTQVQRMAALTDFMGKTCLEVGARDGRHSQAALSLGSEYCLAIEGRAESIQYARSIQPQPVQFAELDVDKRFPVGFGQFDVVFAYGILYHLQNPYQLLQELTSRCRGWLFLSTHCVDRPVVYSRGWGGVWMPENSFEVSSLDEKPSFWLAGSELMRALDACGFEVVQIESDEISGIPAVWVAARPVGVD